MAASVSEISFDISDSTPWLEAIAHTVSTLVAKVKFGVDRDELFEHTYSRKVVATNKEGHRGTVFVPFQEPRPKK